MSDVIPYKPPLAIGSIGARSSGFWGVVFLVLSEASLFAYLLFAFYYFAIQPHPGPWPSQGPPTLVYGIAQTVAVLAGSGAVWWADQSAARGQDAGTVLGLAVALALGIAFIALQLIDWHAEPFSMVTDPYGSLYYLLGGVHLLHLAVGVVMLAAVTLWAALGYFGPARHAPVTIAAFYWYFVTVMWLLVFFALDITPYLR